MNLRSAWKKTRSMRPVSSSQVTLYGALALPRGGGLCLSTRTANVAIVPVHATMTPEAQAAEHGEALWERQPDVCCDIRKVQPLHGHLDTKAAWITGLRRDQASTRTDTPAVAWDAKFGLAKINPLVGWDEKQSWAYIFAHDLPYNPLHDQNYPTLGCTNCTIAVAPGDDPRSGRWAGTGKIECGLHSD